VLGDAIPYGESRGTITLLSTEECSPKEMRSGNTVRIDDVDFESQLFPEHPAGWRSPADLAEGFLVAWSLEVRERRRIAPHDPFASYVVAQLPPAFRFDTFGELVRVTPGAPASAVGDNQRARLTTLFLVWRLFDDLNSNFRLRQGDSTLYAKLLSFVTGGTERDSVFRDLSADWAKCLLSDRVQHAYEGTDLLTSGEEWFATGDVELVGNHPGGPEAIPFLIAGNVVPMIPLDDGFVLSVWAAVRVLVEQNSEEFYLVKYSHRIPIIIDILERGAKLGELRKSLPPAQAWGFDPWPGWRTGDTR
jgi:hypothetical protein